MTHVSVSTKNLVESLLQEEARKELMKQRKPNVKQEELKVRALADPYVMTTEGLGYNRLLPRLHGKWGATLAREIDPKKLNGYRGFWQAFRGSYKTSLLSVGFSV